MQTCDSTVVLDMQQLREMTLSDEDLMQEVLAALIDDTASQLPLLELAIREQDAKKCVRLAHYSKGACANVGAKAAAAALGQIERQAARGSFLECREQLVILAEEVERLRERRI